MIDQIKIGGFLRELRKEKGLTQEELAEKFYVSSRSVSRWENGNTLPELGILVELADFYEVDIRELIDGERKREKMEKETKETLKKVSEYADTEKNAVVRRKCFVIFLATAVTALCIALGYLLLPRLPDDSILKSSGFWMGIAIIGLLLLWGTVLYTNRTGGNKEQ